MTRVTIPLHRKGQKSFMPLFMLLNNHFFLLDLTIQLCKKGQPMI